MARRLILLGDKTLSGIERALNDLLSRHRMPWTVSDAGFDSWLREILEPRSLTNQETDSALGFLLSPRVLESPASIASQIDSLLDTLKHRTPSRTVLFSNMFPDPAGVLPLTRHEPLLSIAAEINAKLYAFSRAHAWFHVVDHAGLALREGTRHLSDARYEATAQMYFSPAGGRTVANLWMRVIRALETPAAKVLVVDLDNTLWRGILGEDGPEGIEMSAGPKGWAYRNLQQALLQLKANGLLLAVSSKNNAEEVRSVLAEHPDCLLRPEAFCAIEVGWGAKSASIRRMSEQLRLGLDAFVFLDDSPFEREEVATALPQVTVLDFPEDPLNLVVTLATTFAFDALRITEEDRDRANSYVAETQRDALREKTPSAEDFYRSLSLQLKLFLARPAHTERLHQLILKTNQFNLTTQRLSADEYHELLEQQDTLVIGMRVADTFGDSGITGLAIVTGVGTDTWTVDNFLLSCRVIGRTVENAFVAWLVERAKAAAADLVRFRFKSSTRNQVAREFLERSGLTWNAAEQVWQSSTEPALGSLASHFVTIEDRDVAR